MQGFGIGILGFSDLSVPDFLFFKRMNFNEVGNKIQSRGRSAMQSHALTIGRGIGGVSVLHHQESWTYLAHLGLSELRSGTT